MLLKKQKTLSNYMYTDPPISSVTENLWKDLKQNYDLADRKDIQEKIRTEISDWSRQLKRSLTVDNPFYEDIKALGSAQQDYKTNNYSIESIQGDLKNYKKFKQKINSQVDDFWDKKLRENRSANSVNTSTLQEKFGNNKYQNLDNLIQQKLENGYETEKLFTEIKSMEKDKNFEDQFGKFPGNNKLKQKIKEEHQNLRAKKSERQGLRGSLLKTWQQELDESIAKWELKHIEDFRKKIWEKLKSWLDLLSKLFNSLESLSLEPGLLFDLSQGELTSQNEEELKKWLEYIAQDEEVRKLCEMMGRLRQAKQSHREEIIKTTKKITVEIADINSREEVTGIRLGNDIENIIPEEKALLSDEDTSLLFDLKYTERRLLCFENQGLTEVEREISEEKKVQVSENDKMGPIIICVDTSGSMSGVPETIAKAITLYMTTKAKQQDRNCYLINYSTNISTLDLSDGFGLAKLLSFLKMSFHGGTDVNPALKEALDVIKKDEYEQADVLIISDFVMSGLPEEIVNSVRSAQSKKNKFYSLCIGNHFYDDSLKSIFNRSWIYNQSNMRIHELPRFLESLS